VPAKTYSAGTIFLQVVPVFGDTMRAIKREAQDANRAWGDEMEKGGKEAGQRAGKAMGEEVTKAAKSSGEKAGADYAGAFQERIKGALRGAQREMDTLNFKTLSDDAEDRVKRIGKLFKELDSEIVADMDDKKVRAKLEFLRADLKKITDGKHELHIDENLAEVIGKVEGGLKVIDKALDKRRELKIETKISDRELGSFEKKLKQTAKRAADSLGDSLNPAIRDIKRRLDGLADAEIGIDVSATAARQQIIDLHRELQNIPSEVDVDLQVNSAVAAAELLAFRKMANTVDGMDVEIDLKVEGSKVAAARGALEALRATLRSGIGADDAANSFRSFSFAILGVATLLPALIPLLGAVGGALLALIPILGAVGVGIGAMVIGFSGIGDAVGALQDVKENAAKDIQSASTTMANAANAVADAERALAEARRAGAEAIEDAARAVARAKEAAAEAIEAALERQKDAQEEYREALKDVAEAERDLAQARKEAKYELLDLDNAVTQNEIDTGQAVISVFEAQANFDAVMSDGSATNQERDVALYALQEAELQLLELRQEQERLAEEKANADKNGIEGTEGVMSAQEALTQAVKDQKDAEEALAEAAEDTAETRVDAAEQVADAERNLTRAREAAARSIADAQRNLNRAQQGYNDALTQTGELGSASMQKLEQAMDKLGPAGRKFARFIQSLRGNFYDLRDTIQTAMLPPIQRAMEQVMNRYGPQFQTFMGNMAGVIGGLFETMADRMTNSPAWKGFFKVVDQLGPTLLENFGLTMINLMEAFASIMTAVAPFAERFSVAMLDLSEAFAKWTASKDGQEAITKFMEYAASVGPMVIDFLGALSRAFGNIAEALAPLGALVLAGITGLFDWIASLDPKTLQTILVAIVGLIAAFQIAVGLTALLAGGAAVLASPVALIVFLFVAAMAAVVALYLRFPEFRKQADRAFKAIGRVAKWMWEKVLKPVFEAWWEVVKFMGKVYVTIFPIIWNLWVQVFNGMAWIWNKILKPVFSAIIAIVQFLWKNVIKPILGFIWGAWKTTFKIMKGAWNSVLFPVLDLFAKLIGKLWTKVFKPILKRIGERWSEFSTGLKVVWQTVLKPIFDAFKDKVLPKLQTAFETVMGAIETVWNTLKAIFAKPIVFVVDTILNGGLIAGFNKIAKAVGSEGMDTITLDQGIRNAANGGNSGGTKGRQYASGGVLPGYTPGQDVHHFSSPSAGSLHLSGGEAIMRPEFTSVVGSGWVDKMNMIARAEGRGGIKRAMFGGQAFAKGGIVFPVPNWNGKKPYVLRTAYNLGHDGMDINHPDDTGPNGQGGVVPILSATSGTITTGSGYGDAIFVNSPYGKLVYGHAYPGSRRFRAGESVGPGAQLGLIGTTGNSSAPHLHFGFPGGTFGQAEGLLSGSAHLDQGYGGNPLAGFAKWLIKAAKNPLGYVKGLISKPIDALKSKFGDNRMVQTLMDVPRALISGVKDKIVSILPGPLKALATSGGAKGETVTGEAGQSGTGVNAAEQGGYFRGGVLPYNGTMKYDSGGYLPPGLTSVVNMTGKPEPVFTSEQFAGMGGASGGETFHYEPHFEGSDLTASDVVRDMDHARRRMRREGRYARNR
jgi:murein DD-endopeptidase MepM/ murein hydrolase activator NlpD